MTDDSLKEQWPLDEREQRRELEKFMNSMDNREQWLSRREEDTNG